MTNGSQLFLDFNGFTDEFYVGIQLVYYPVDPGKFMQRQNTQKVSTVRVSERHCVKTFQFQTPLMLPFWQFISNKV